MQFDISDRQTGRTTRLVQQVLFDITADPNKPIYPIVCVESKHFADYVFRLLIRFNLQKIVNVCSTPDSIFTCTGCLPKDQIRLYVDDLECNKPFLQFLKELDLNIPGNKTLLESAYFAATSSDAVAPLRALGLNCKDLRVTSTVRMAPMGFI